MKKIIISVILLINVVFAQTYINFSENYTLPNGLEVILISDSTYRTITAGITFKLPTKFQGQYIGYTTFLTHLMTYSSTNISDKDLFLLNKYDILRSFADDNKIAFSTYKDFTDTLFYVMSEIILNPNLTSDNMVNFKKKILPSVKKYNQEIANVATNVYRRSAFTHNSPASEFATQNSIIDITSKLLKQHYDTYIIPNNSTLIVVGNFEAPKVKELINKYFTNWKPKKNPEFVHDMNYFTNLKDTIAIVNVNNIDYPFIYIATPFNLSKDNPDILYAQFLGLMFGNHTYKHFFKDTNNTEYYNDAVFQNSGNHSAITIAKQIPYDSIGKFITEYKKVFNQFFSNDINPVEFVKAKNVIINAIKSQLNNSVITFNFLADFKANNYTNEYIKNYLDTIEKLKISELKNFIKNYLSDVNFYCVLLADSTKLTDDFKSNFKYNIYDQYGNYIDPNLFKIPANINAETILKNYVTKMNSNLLLNKTQNLMFSFKGLMKDEQGDKETETKLFFSLKDNKFLKHMTVNGEEELLVKFDGKQIFQNSKFFGAKILNEKEAYETLYEALYLPQMRLKELEITANLKNIEYFNNTYAYNIEMTDKYGNKWNEYYDKNSYLLVGYKKVTKNVQMDITETTFYNNYEVFNEILTYTNLTTKILNQSATFELKDLRTNLNLAKNFFEIKKEKQTKKTKK